MKLGQVALTVEDLPAAVAFHKDVLGLPFLFEAPNLAFFDLGAARLMLSAAEATGDHQEFVLYYRVDDLNTAWHDALAKGAQAGKEPHLIAKMPDHDLWMAFLRDSDARLVGLMSEVRN
jgi:methylmalonyl-CoA/ethylmalonyl-CoA epimerase